MDVREKLVEVERAAEWFEKRAENTPMPMARKMFELAGEALREKANGVTVQEWISVKDRLPESGVHILAAVKMDGLFCNGHYVCDAFYAAKYTQSISGYSDECACVYCEEDDEYYLEEGWYEVIKNWDDYNSIVISDTVTHWMPLPQPPKGE